MPERLGFQYFSILEEPQAKEEVWMTSGRLQLTIGSPCVQSLEQESGFIMRNPGDTKTQFRNAIPAADGAYRYFSLNIFTRR